jgi:uncharacterized damage-inducible protein DinB
MEEIGKLAAGNVAFLRQGLDLIRRLSDAQYSTAPPLFHRGGVGAHFRHILDHYDCFLDGLPEGRVDYDHRRRDHRLEVDRAAAAGKIEEICGRLDRLEGDAARPLRATLLCGELEDASPVWSGTSLARELQFLVSHTVHHYAVIAAMLRPQGVEPGADFGVAPSTLMYERGVYERGNAVCAP